MRIDGTVNINPLSSRKNTKGKKGSEAVFKPDTTSQSPAAAPNFAMGQSSGIEAMLALQGVDNNVEGKQRAVRHAHSMLDTLDEIKADFLAGNVGEGRLNRLMAQVTRARQQAEPELISLIDDIDLLAKVELAKMGRYVK